MPTTLVNAPDGGLISVNHPDNASDESILGYAARMYSEDPSVSLRDDTSVLGQIKETAKGVPRGFANTFLGAGEGLAELADAATNFVGYEDLIDSGEENELVRLAREGKEYIKING